MSKISPCLWFDGQGEEAANFYVDLFRRCGQPAKIVEIMRSGPEDAAIAIYFELGGNSFLALNGGPQFKFNEAVSMSIDCEDQAEVDAFWDALLDGGKPIECGWLTDRYGLSWQVIPKRLPELLCGKDREKAARAMAAMQTMVKIDVAKLEAAVR